MYSFADMHCDTAVKAYERNEGMFENLLHLDIKRLLNYNAPVQFFAIWLDKKYHNNAFLETIKRIDFYYNQIELNKNLISHVNSFNDILKAKKAGKISGILSVEGGEALEGNIKNLHTLHEKGVRAMTLTWNNKNHIGCGAGGEGGLTDFGIEVVKEMEKLNMLVDVSHLNDDGFWDVIKIAEKPVFASHSNSRSVTETKRNLTDEQMKAIAQKGGIIGLNMYKSFLTKNNDAAIENVLEHIDYIMKIVGEDYIGLGCDFDGIDEMPTEINGVQDMTKFFCALEKKYGENITAKIAENNFLRYFSQWS